MTTNTVTTLDDVNALIKDFDAKFKNPFLNLEAKNNKEIVKLETNTADKSYDLIAALVDLAKTLSVYQGVVMDCYKQFLISRSLAVPRGANNAYLPFIKAVFSEQIDGKWVFEKRGVEKYANILRHIIDLMDRGALKGTIQDYIRNYNDPLYGVKLKGIEAQDRADNPSKGAEDRVKTLRKTGMNAPALAKVATDFGIPARKVVVLYGQTNINGEVEVLKVKALEDDAADSFYYSLGRDLTPAK